MASQCGHTDYESEIIDDCKVCMRAHIAKFQAEREQFIRVVEAAALLTERCDPRTVAAIMARCQELKLWRQSLV